MKGYSPHRAAYTLLYKPQNLLRLVGAAACLTVIVTIFSLNELSTLINQADPDANRVDWREVAGRAVKHAEALPHLPHIHGRSATNGKGVASGTQF